MPEIRPSWSSTDSTTVRVDSLGTATAVRAGEAWVIAKAAGLADSAMVEVTFALQAGEGRLRLRSGGTDRIVGLPRPSGVMVDFLSHKQTLFVLAENAPSSADTALAILLPAMPSPGRIPLEVWHPSMLDSMDNVYYDIDRPIAFLLINAPQRTEVVPLQGWVEVEVEQGVPGPGTRQGLLGSRLVAAGSGFLQSRLASGRVTWTSTSSSYQVVTDLRPAYEHYPVGTSAGQVTGLSTPVSWTMREAWWSYTGAPRLPYNLDVEDGPPDIYVQMSGPNSTDLATGAAHLQLHDWTARDSQSGYATGGRIEVTRYVPSQGPDLYGEMVGRVVANGEMKPYASAAYPFQTTFEFHVPVFPERSPNGSPAGFDALSALAPGFAQPGSGGPPRPR